ncbi:MAG: tyrosine-protein phosphatase, partial [Pseudoflavonifractor sp.]
DVEGQPALLWAAEQGIISGDGTGNFRADAPVTREQAAVMLQGYARVRGDGMSATADLSAFSDGGMVSGWAKDEVQWAVGKSILNPQNGSVLPLGGISPEEGSAMLTRYAATAQSAHSLGLSKVENARQLGGYRTEDGRRVKDGLLLRSGKLSGATPEDKARLTATYHLTQVVDFRTTDEIAAGPDPALTGVTNTHIGVLDESGSGSSSSSAITGIYGADPVDAIIGMVKDGVVSDEMYLSFLSDAHSLAAYRQFFEVLLANQSGATLWHCTGGKDRAGTAAALLLSALGVDRETVLQDFALTNDFNAAKIAYMADAAAQKGADPVTVAGVRTLVGVDRSFMEKLLNTIDKTFGSVPAFFTAKNGLGLSETQLATLKDMYLE